IRLDPHMNAAHGSLGIALEHQKKYDEAIACFQEAIRVNPTGAVRARSLLGHVLRRKGEYAEALASFQRGYKLGSKQNKAEPVAGQWIPEAEQMDALAPRLPALLKGADQPTDVSERLALAQICADREWYAAAVRFWSEAFAQDPQQADDLSSRYIGY